MEWPADQVERRAVDVLLPYAQNARTHSDAQVDQLVASIREWGWTMPVLVDEAGTIIAGHGRVLAARKLGLQEVPVMVARGWTDTQRRAYVLADNRLALNAGWDKDLLGSELQALQADGFDMPLLGFEDLELLSFLDSTKGGNTDPDDVPEPLAEVVSAPGDVWVLGPHRVMCGSGLLGEDWSRLMDGQLADACWTDPPYNVDIGGKNEILVKAGYGKRKSTGGILNDKMGGAEFRQFLLDMYSAVFAVLKPGAPIYVAHADSEGANFRATFVEAGFKLQSCLIWRKNQIVLGRSDYQWIHEPILYGWKPGSRHRWYGGRKNTTVVDLGDAGPFTKLEDGRYQIKVGDAVLVVSADAVVEEHPSSMLYEQKPAKSDLHPTQKPVALVERMLKYSARAGDLVVDAFGGSGTTLLAADRLGMCSRLMEIDPKFVDVIVRRWQQYTGRQALHAVSGEPFPAEEADCGSISPKL